MAYVLYTPLASTSLPLFDGPTPASASLPPPYLSPCQTHHIHSLQTSSAYAATDVAHYIQAPQQLPRPHYQQYASNESAAIPIAYSAPYLPLPLVHDVPPEYNSSQPPRTSHVFGCNDWLKRRCKRGTRCRFHHSKTVVASSAFAPASLHPSASPVPPSMNAAGVTCSFPPQPSFVPGCTRPSMVDVCSSIPPPYGAYTALPSADASAALNAAYGGGGLLPFPSYLSYPHSLTNAPYAPQTPSRPNSPFHSTATFSTTAHSTDGSAVDTAYSPSSSVFSFSSASLSSAADSSAGSLSPVNSTCTDFQHGQYFRGESCRSTHDMRLCDDWLNHKCTRGASCRFSHDKRAGPLCCDWLQGRCIRGDECRYFHLNKPQRAANVAETANGECRDWTRGRCLRGAACKFAHSSIPPRAAPVVNGAAVNIVHTRARKHSGTSSQHHPLPMVNVTVDPALQSAFGSPLQVTVTQQADTRVLHITLTNRQEEAQYTGAVQLDHQPQQTRQSLSN